MKNDIEIKHSLLQKIAELKNTYVSKLGQLLGISIDICYSYCEEIHFDGYVDFIDASSTDGKDAIIRINGKGEVFSQNGGYKSASDEVKRAEQSQKRTRIISNVSKLFIIISSISTLILGVLVYLQNSRINELETQLKSVKFINSAPYYIQETKLVLKAVFRGGYSNFENDKDSNYYYLVDIHLINNTDSICEFITYSCSSLINILSDHKEYGYLFHNCASNYDTPVRLRPKQEFTLPVILFRNSHLYKSDDPVKFGFILLTRKYLFSQEESAYVLLDRMRKRQENIIWSSPIILHTTSFHPYEIRYIINDTTFSKASDH